MLVLLDLSAAFDTVDHNILLSVLGSPFMTQLQTGFVHICQAVLSPLFMVAIRRLSSDCSVPQGSVLGPLEFTVHRRRE